MKTIIIDGIEYNLTPKARFKKGDWVVTSYGKVNQVVSVDKDGDGYTLDDGVYFSGSWCDMYHLWTINDAKDGDVLYSPCCKLLWIYKDGNSCYIGNNLYYNENCVVVNTSISIPTDAIPATKEQRELLFQKMKEAGYEWDAEKKELKKIEQKPAWNEEDEYVFSKVLDWMLIVNPTSSIFEKLPKEQFIERFKSLKERVQLQPKQEWSEEDEKELELLEAYITSGEWSEAHVNRAIGIIGSLHPRSRWKPNKEQLEALEYYIRSFGESGTISPYGPKFQNLQSLYFDLKKL